MSEKIAITIKYSEDSCDIIAPNGSILCSINRDDDSSEAGIKVLRALGFVVIEEDEDDI